VPPPATGEADSATVRAWRGHYTIPTYQLGPTNPYARFHQLSGKITYPYLDQQFFLNEKKDQRYRALYLENKYIKLTVLPERGGRVIEVLDKTTGEQVFHTNDVLKPARIALRGAFFSGGIEWNPGPQG
ncbi:MAG: DUF5107 domain-containing protein, partial [Salinibacter sp.]